MCVWLELTVANAGYRSLLTEQFVLFIRAVRLGRDSNFDCRVVCVCVWLVSGRLPCVK